MKRLMMLLMLWTGLITAVYIVDAAKPSRDAPATYTVGSSISDNAVNLIYYPYTGQPAPGAWTSDPYTANTNVILPDPVAGKKRWYTNKADLRRLRSGKGRL